MSSQVCTYGLFKKRSLVSLLIVSHKIKGLSIIIIYKLILVFALILSFTINNNTNSLGFFRYYLILATILDAIVGSLLVYFRMNNSWIYNIFILIQVPYFIWLFSQFIMDSGSWKQLHKINLAILIISFCNFFFIQGIHQVNNFSYLLGMSFLTVLIVKFYFIILLSDSTDPIVKMPLFWLSVGILAFYTASFPILAYLNIIIDSQSTLTEPLYDLVGIGNIFLSISYIFVIVCPWMTQK